MSLSFTDFFKTDSKTLPQYHAWRTTIDNGGIVPVDPTTTAFSLAAATTSAKEGAAGTWTLTLANGAADQAYSVNLAESFTNATAADVGTLAVTGATFADGVVTFDAGITAATITVPFLKDALTPEVNELVVLTISNASNDAVINTAHTAATIAITDVAPTAGDLIAVTEGNIAPGENAADANLTFQFTAGTYDYNIAGFATGDVLDFPEGSLFSITNTDFTDGNVDVVAVAPGEKTMTIHLTGLATPESFNLSSPEGFNAVFGAESLI